MRAHRKLRVARMGGLLRLPFSTWIQCLEGRYAGPRRRSSAVEIDA